MKKLLSISFAFLILLSGMHISVATHICGGEVAEVKWSFSGEKGTCGMENPFKLCPVHNGISSKSCCQDEVAAYTVDSNYSPSSFQTIKASNNLVQVFYVPVNLLFHSLAATTPLFTNISPHNKLPASAVSLPDICVFRI